MGVPEDNFYESSCAFHCNLQTHHPVTTYVHQVFL
jgi:hypothetical protein